ncbi:ATPase expression protein 3 [Kluyveromyces marxianus DMKU3-1042]|uniref:ATPase expression protein 3 n=1 Tax=Kluyveromyces marxianus (strain DMKU3-1042 / BCC 29191 / NBRC 104275) TaxID=1003335 RepID=W0TAD2_KLUMD|nr:ATPase expression protein 3 [Kluyveromyces marxianus DMKU3-1042]BAO40345.1 ATPase expression protein 3 [Kluyveromyces marxianus DMKU3-1042]
MNDTKLSLNAVQYWLNPAEVRDRHSIVMDRLRVVMGYLKKTPICISSPTLTLTVSPANFKFPSTQAVKNETTKERETCGIPASNVREEYLKSLDLPYLSRISKKEGPYDYKRAMEFSKALKRTMDSKSADQTIFSLCSESIAKLISLLLQITPDKLVVPSSTRIFPRELFTDIPKLTDEITSDTDKFANYIGLLTHTKFHYKGSSSQGGIIPKLLNSLLHPSNSQTVKLKSTSVFNDVIFYYTTKNNFATCRELFAQMKAEGFNPDTMTYNLLLRSLRKNDALVKQKLPYDEAVFYLTKMKIEGVPADVITWNTCYLLLKDNISRAIFLEKMIEKNVPLTQHIIHAVLGASDVPYQAVINFLVEYDFPIDTNIIKICFSKLIEEENYERSWKLLEHAKRSKFNVSDPFFLETYIRKFADMGRMDLSLITFNTLTTKYMVTPTLHCYDMLFKCLVRQGYHKNFGVVYKYLVQKLKHLTGGKIISNYWIVKSRAILKFNIGSKGDRDISQAVSDLDHLIKKCVWNEDKGLKIDCWDQYYQYRRLFRTVGAVPHHTSSKKLNKEQYPAEASRKKKKYIKRMKETSIANKKLKDAQYEKDYYGALKNDLLNRGIMDN